MDFKELAETMKKLKSEYEKAIKTTEQIIEITEVAMQMNLGTCNFDKYMELLKSRIELEGEKAKLQYVVDNF